MQNNLHLQLCKLLQNESNCVFLCLGWVKRYWIVLFCRSRLLCNFPRIFILPCPRSNAHLSPTASPNTRQRPGAAAEFLKLSCVYAHRWLQEDVLTALMCTVASLTPTQNFSQDMLLGKWEKGETQTRTNTVQRMTKYCVYKSKGVCFVVVWECVEILWVNVWLSITS